MAVWLAGRVEPVAELTYRFEQTALELQPNSPSAMGMVAQDPVRLVDGRRATCDGGTSGDPPLGGAVLTNV